MFVLENCRRGASSGILLGAVTLPSVMISKLVQLSRAISIHEAEQDGNFHSFCIGLMLVFRSLTWFDLFVV